MLRSTLADLLPMSWISSRPAASRVPAAPADEKLGAPAWQDIAGQTGKFCRQPVTSGVRLKTNSVRFFEDRWNLALMLLLALAVARLWIQQIGSGFWVDEMVTVFVVHHGPADRSLAVAPQVPQSVYYSVAHLADRLFGACEIAYRLPSILFS